MNIYQQAREKLIKEMPKWRKNAILLDEFNKKDTNLLTDFAREVAIEAERDKSEDNKPKKKKVKVKIT